jgi:hypothetical protein
MLMQIIFSMGFQYDSERPLFFSVFFKKEINPASFEFFPALKSIKQKIPFFWFFSLLATK